MRGSWNALDDFEGDLYERRAVEVLGGRTRGSGPRPTSCATQRTHLLSPHDWDEAVFRARELEGYLEGCRAFAAEWAAGTRD